MAATGSGWRSCGATTAGRHRGDRRRGATPGSCCGASIVYSPSTAGATSRCTLWLDWCSRGTTPSIGRPLSLRSAWRPRIRTVRWRARCATRRPVPACRPREWGITGGTNRSGRHDHPVPGRLSHTVTRQELRCPRTLEYKGGELGANAENRCPRRDRYRYRAERPGRIGGEMDVPGRTEPASRRRPLDRARRQSHYEHVTNRGRDIGPGQPGQAVRWSTSEVQPGERFDAWNGIISATASPPTVMTRYR
jgi:hypothetical protein